MLILAPKMFERDTEKFKELMVGHQNVYINLLWAAALETLRTTALKGS